MKLLNAAGAMKTDGQALPRSVSNSYPPKRADGAGRRQGSKTSHSQLQRHVEMRWGGGEPLSNRMNGINKKNVCHLGVFKKKKEKK